MEDNQVIRLENVEKIYHLGEVEVHALAGVNISIFDREFLSIVGPSGSGKSTMLHLIGCLDRPTSGRVFLDGTDISKLSDSNLARLRGREIGFIFQFFNLYPTLDALQNVELPMMILNVDETERRERARSLLDMVGLGDRRAHLPAQLSGGERQRVAIARALANDPSLILADEPTGNLDSKSGKEVLKIFKKLNEEGRTIVIVTHDQNIADLAKRKVEMKDGRVEEIA
ncbi:MAG: ABC transporter ATP-binding protein [Candidatus Hydrothermarchaeales archaeon]